jgi:hypothetical protein
MLFCLFAADLYFRVDEFELPRFFARSMCKCNLVEIDFALSDLRHRFRNFRLSGGSIKFNAEISTPSRITSLCRTDFNIAFKEVRNKPNRRNK